MTRKKFIKELMAAGISRNTATAAADAASRAEIPLIKEAGRILNMQRLFVGCMAPVKYWRKAFDQALRTQAEITPRRIRPLAKKRHQDGLRIDFAVVDEITPELIATGVYVEAMRQVVHHTKPYTPSSLGTDFTNMQVMSQADHAALHRGGGT